MVDRSVGDLPSRIHSVVVPGPGGPVPVRVVVSFVPDGRPVEVFIHGAPDGLRAAANVISRIISRSLQAGIPLADVIRMCSGQGGDSWAPARNANDAHVVVSLGDGVARVLDRYQTPAAPPA